MNVDKRTTRLGFLIFPGFPMACLTSAIEPLRAANEISDTRAFSWELISETGERVRSSAEVGFDADLALNDAEDFDYIFVLSGPRTVFGNHKASNGHLRRLSRHGVNLGGISGGVFPLARAGLLSGHACSVHWCYEAAFSSEFPDHKMTNDVITIDRKRYTVSGAAAAFDLMLHLIDVKLGYATSTEVACWFQHPLVRGQGVRQKIPTYRSQSTSDMLPRIVSEALEVFGRHISEPLPVQEVARMIGVSPRHLERKFKGATGQSPSHYYRSLRMHAARQLVLYSKDTLTQISHAVGYATATPMVRHYRAAFGVSPDADRRKINVFRVENNRA
ncbi:MAG: GlxA family transcriptional regulator, partial [Paracoccaceae bacterium]